MWIQQSPFLSWGVGCPDSSRARKPSSMREAMGREAAWSLEPLQDMGLHFGTSLTSRVTLGKSLNPLTLRGLGCKTRDESRRAGPRGGFRSTRAASRRLGAHPEVS